MKKEPPPYSFNRKLVGPRGRFGSFGEEHHFLPLLGIESRLVKPALFSLCQYPGSGLLVNIRSKSEAAGSEDAPSFTCKCQQAYQFQAVHGKLGNIYSQNMPNRRIRYWMEISNKLLTPALRKSALCYWHRKPGGVHGQYGHGGIKYLCWE
jgi:hypothetical protein